LSLWPSTSAIIVYAQINNNKVQTIPIGQLISNITQARDAIASGNSTDATLQLTGIIGELSNTLGIMTSDQDGQYLDQHTHVFVHKGQTHTVTHKHPHNADHHHYPLPPIPPPIPHPDWFQQHRIFNPSDCTPDYCARQQHRRRGNEL